MKKQELIEKLNFLSDTLQLHKCKSIVSCMDIPDTLTSACSGQKYSIPLTVLVYYFSNSAVRLIERFQNPSTNRNEIVISRNDDTSRIVASYQNLNAATIYQEEANLMRELEISILQTKNILELNELFSRELKEYFLSIIMEGQDAQILLALNHVIKQTLGLKSVSLLYLPNTLVIHTNRK